MKSYHDIVGDGGSRILEQVGELRARIERRLAGVRHVVAIGSGKGGVGKSTLTFELGRALAARGRSTAILDADLNGPSQAHLAGLRAVPLVPGADGAVLPRSREGIGVLSLGSSIPESEALEFDSVAAGESHTWRATREFTALAELIASVDWGTRDYLLVDLPPGAERTVQYADFLGPRAALLLVTLPSALARGVVSRSIAALARTPNRLLGYVENMKGYHCRGCDAVRPLFPETDEPGLPGLERLECLGAVPFDPELAARGTPGAAQGDGGPAQAALGAVADRMVEILETKR